MNFVAALFVLLVHVNECPSIHFVARSSFVSNSVDVNTLNSANLLAELMCVEDSLCDNFKQDVEKGRTGLYDCRRLY